MPLFFSIRDACAHLSIGRTSLYRAIGDGLIRPVKFGKRTLVPRDELERFAASLTNS
jgi:excisionase family DNA binding protein